MKYIIDINDTVLKELNISMEQLEKYKYIGESKKGRLTTTEKNRRYYEKHKEKIKEKNLQKAKEYYLNNREMINQRRREKYRESKRNI